MTETETRHQPSELTHASRPRSDHQAQPYRLWHLGLISIATMALVGCASNRPAPPADLVVINAKIVTVDSKSTIAQAIAVKDSRFQRVGSQKDIAGMIGPNTKVVDAGGRTIIPGLTDSHFHGTGNGPGVDLSKTRSFAELFAKIGEAAKNAAAGAVVVSNGNWHEAQFTEKRLPTAAELEKAAPGVPVILVRGGHSYFLNNTALAKYGITTSTPVPAGGAIPKDANGNLTGELTDQAKSLAPLPPRPALNVDYLVAEQKVINSYGLTSVRMPGIPISTYRLLQQMRDEKTATVRYNVLFRVTAPSGLQPIADAGIKPLEGDDWVKVWGIKLMVDGGFEGGHMTAPYLDPMGKGGTYFGLEVVPQNTFDDMVIKLNRMGFRAGTHAVGDAGLDQVLRGYEKANKDKDLTKAGWAIEHAFVTRPDQYPRMRALNLRLSVQDHLYLAAPVLKGYWGMDRASQVTPLKTYADEGFLPALGTDSPVVPMNPFWVMYHFLTRDTISDGVYGAKQAVVSRDSILRMMTINNAKLTDEEADKGSIEVGKLADFAMLSADYMTIPAVDVQNLKAMATYVGGKLVYNDPQFRP